MPNTPAIIPVILSGGSGTRLWPLSTAARPKQFLEFVPGGTMLAQTLARAPADSFGEPLVICNAAHAELVLSQCAGRAVNLILEPSARNTAPAIALAALSLPPEALMLVMPSDHVIADVGAFHRAIASAQELAQDGWLVTFGITPTGPETGYGYIRSGEELGSGLWRAEQFVEKPDAATAQTYLDEGCYNWNAGIFLFNAGAYIEALSKHAPEMLEASRRSLAAARREGASVHPEAEAFAACPSDSVDYAVMEKAERVAVVPVDMGWSDIGSWDALHDLLPKDDAGNVLVGDVTALGSSGCLVRTDGPAVAVTGVDNLIVIASADAVMILPRGQSQDVKTIVEALKAAKHPVMKR